MSDKLDAPLKVCPWCGSPGKLMEDRSSDYKQHWTWSVVCQDPTYWSSEVLLDAGCGESGPSRKTAEEAVAAWNTRF